MKDPFHSIVVGDVAEIQHVVSPHDVEAFASLTGDVNPLHMDDAFAAKTPLRKRVVHGMLSASFISTLIGMRLPGPGSLWVEQSLKFLGPVRIGEKIRVVGKVIRKSDGQRVLTIKTDVYGDDDRHVIAGEAVVKVPELERADSAADPKTDGEGAIIVTGGSRGIGAAVAMELAGAGHSVIVVGSSDVTAGEAVCEKISEAGGTAIYMQADVTDEDAVQSLVRGGIARFGKVQGFVHAAAPRIKLNALGDTSWADIQKQMEVQLKGVLSLFDALLPHLVENGGGKVVTLTTAALDNPPRNMASYLTAKAALRTATHAIAVEYGAKGIRANMIAPGMTETDLVLDWPEKAKLLEKARTPLGRLATPSDISGAVAFLFSSAARHITGQTIRISGGTVVS